MTFQMNAAFLFDKMSRRPLRLYPLSGSGHRDVCCFVT